VDQRGVHQCEEHGSAGKEASKSLQGYAGCDAQFSASCQRHIYSMPTGIPTSQMEL